MAVQPSRCIELPNPPSSLRGALLATIALFGAAPSHAQQPAIPQWSLSSAPILSLGEAGSGAPEFLRIMAVFRLSPDLIGVVNGGTSQIMLFDGAGGAIRSVGRKGAGPGELEGIAWAGRVEDTALIYDSNLRRITRLQLRPEPLLLGTLPVTARGGRNTFGVCGLLPDGHWLVETYLSPGWSGPPGVYGPLGSAGLIARNAAGTVNWLGDFPSGAIPPGTSSKPPSVPSPSAPGFTR